VSPGPGSPSRFPAPRKRFGQHFLHDRGVLDRIVAAIAPQPDDRMLEVGPGRGALTARLLERVAHLHAVEIDRDLAAALSAAYPPARLSVHRADVLDFDLKVLPPGLRVVGNLPYNISTPLLFHLLNDAGRILDMHFMLQDEVVRRMVAGPSSAEYGRLSVMVQNRCEAVRLFGVPPGAFNPPPKVHSAIVRLVPRQEHGMGPEAASHFAALVGAAFSHRRKTLRNALAGLLTEQAIEAAGIDPGLRAENLSVEDYRRLAAAAGTGAGTGAGKGTGADAPQAGG
jgi:16S rRNA (adenine1518-N6/adenine1519-N6)-dimethyltransferase